MRNLSIDQGLVKNARVVIRDMGTRVIAVQLLHTITTSDSDPFEDDIILIPRITFTAGLPSGYTLCWNMSQTDR
jgi:hypothetical protein